MGLFFGGNSVSGAFTTTNVAGEESVKPSGTTSSGKTYGTSLASEVLEEVLNGTLTKTVEVDITGEKEEYEQFSGYSYQPADVTEYYQDILTSDNDYAVITLTKVLG
jgi:hypothetical protein